MAKEHRPSTSRDTYVLLQGTNTLRPYRRDGSTLHNDNAKSVQPSPERPWFVSPHKQALSAQNGTSKAGGREWVVLQNFIGGVVRSLLIEAEISHLDDIAIDVVFQNSQRLLRRNRSCQQLDQVSSFDDHVGISRLARGAHGHGPLDQVELASYAAFLTDKQSHGHMREKTSRTGKYSL